MATQEAEDTAGAGGSASGGMKSPLTSNGGAVASSQYCLKWNNHQNNLLTVLDHLYQTEAFCDVTLACDNTSIKCHKMILSACSSYFQTLFMENTCEHPIVFLKDIKISEVRAILDYMYKGEVNVAQEELPGKLLFFKFLRTKILDFNKKILSSSSQNRKTAWKFF